MHAHTLASMKEDSAVNMSLKRLRPDGDGSKGRVEG